MARKRSKRLPKSFVKLREDITRITKEMRDAMTRRPPGVTPPPPSRDKWGDLIAKRSPSRTDLKKVRAALRQPKRVRFDPKPLRQLAEQDPHWTNDQLLTEYENLTGAKPSISWVKQHK
jgi:hypothetical protein